MQKGLDLLLEKYSVDTKATLKNNGKTLEINGETYPVLPYESERRFIELRNLVLNKRVGNMCTYRIGHTAQKGTDLFELLTREIGILEFTVDSKVKEIFAIKSENAMNCIAETENGCVCTLELAATLNGTPNVDKHEIITDNGVACDRVVDTQTPQSSIYVYGKENKTFTDTDAELYGLSEIEINTVRNAFLMAKCVDTRIANKQRAEHIAKVLEAAKQSLDTLCNVVVEG